MDFQAYQGDAAIYLILVIIGANIGSMSSIRAEWHDRSIYHRCIMPKVMEVCIPASIFGFFFGLLADYVLVEVIGAGDSIALITGGIIALYISFASARQRGRRIYDECVRRAGF